MNDGKINKGGVRMEQLLIRLTRKAHAEQVVAIQALASGAQLLAYPLDAGLMIGVGYDPALAHQVHAESLVSKRSTCLSRYGAWLPTLFADGSCYVVRKIDYFSPASDVPVLTSDDLMAAQELLS
ncbi:MAG: hypothetical protein ACXWIN_05375 [Burkholderiaceae bacterium]